MRLNVASPASVTVHSIASIVEPGLCGGPTLALLRTLSRAEFVSIAIPASDGGLKLFVELPLAALPLHLSLLAASSTAFHTHAAAVLPANISDLSR